MGSVTSRPRRAAAFALVASFALAAPVLGRVAAVPFALVAAAAFATDDGPLFDLFARPGDRQAGRLAGLVSFALAATGLAVLTTLADLPTSVFVGSVLLVGYGNLGAELARAWRPLDIVTTTGFAVFAFVGAALGQVAAPLLSGAPLPSLATVAFFAASGALLGALVRAVFFTREDPLVLLSVALLLWWFSDLGVATTPTAIAGALVVTVGFGYLSWALKTASIPGMLTGVFLSLLTIVLGDYRWFAVLIAFFALGGLSSKFRYGRKAERGVAEAQGGARGSGNVLGNSAAATVAVALYAASGGLSVAGSVFLYAFAGSVATALADTLSSEVGCLFDSPRLITTLDPVAPGTDGAVTWQGELAGLAGAVLIAGLSGWLFSLSLLGLGAIAVAGLVGMTADSLLGAIVEGGLVGNQTVNFLATSLGAVCGGALALLVL